MQKIENSKESLNALLSNYRPIGPRHLLAAALMAQARRDEESATEVKAARRVRAA
jgi:hypothetical protein